jgi:RHS repeat-associated protein
VENGRGDRYGYDEAGQLTLASYQTSNPNANGADAERVDIFSYDALGNRMQDNHLASRGWMNFTRDDNGLNQYTGWWPYNFIKYDDDVGPPWGAPHAANGVIMQDGWISGGFNALNQPIQIASQAYNGTADWMWFGFDPLGRCVKRWVSSSGVPTTSIATFYYYDGWNLLQEGASGANAQRLYIHGGRVDEIVKSFNYTTGQSAYHHYDARGHCTMLTDPNGNILEQYDYDAFGFPRFHNAAGQNLTVYDGPSNSERGYSPYGNRFLFTGREWLTDLKLYDYRNRMYQPELGRFLQPDPKQFDAGDYNLYRYCHNDPVNKIDPTGLDTYQQNRDFDGLGGGVSYQSNFNIGTHSFTFTTNPDGSIAHTYSWGNTGNDRGWHIDRTVDRNAAEQAMTLPRFLQNKVGDSTLDPYIQKAFDQLNKKENEHQNLGVARNCKWEATNLLHLARQLQKKDQEAQKREKEKAKLHPTEVGTYKPTP